MFEVVKIGDKNIPMLAVASANIYYKRVFGEDPIIMQADRDMTAGENIMLFMNMGYIMACLAECKGDMAKMQNLNEDTYCEWVSQFNNADYLDAVTDISAVYNGQNRTASVEKKDQD